MAENNHTSNDLKRLQSYDLNNKIQISIAKIMEWYNRNDKNCYVSFSGGKDSTVLAWLTAQVCSLFNCKLVLWFSDTGLEFPELREHVKTYSEWLKLIFSIEVETIIDIPKDKNGKRITFKDVIQKYGYPLISKEVAKKIWEYRSNPDGYTKERFDDNSDYIKKYGMRYSISKWKFLRDSNIPISHKCCDELKKKPAKKFEKESMLKPILDTMACESNMRRSAWLKNGCNAFEAKRPMSQPMSFWTEQDVLECLVRYEIPYPSVYGEIIRKNNGQYYTTGLERTGCMFCGFGVHLQKEPNNFQRMKTTHPKIWNYCMKSIEDGGLGMKEVLEYIGVKIE